MIYNYTRCESVIAKVMADLNISEKNIRITDIREWIFEALDKIGAPLQYEHVESGSNGEPILVIQDYQVPLPTGIHQIEGIAYSNSKDGEYHLMRSNTSVFKENKHKHHHCCCDDDKLLPEKISTTAQLYTINGMKYFTKVAREMDEPTYFLKPGWIVTNRKKGYIKVAFTRTMVDERGYPIIPDLTSVQEAIYWYVTMKLSFPKYMKGQLGGKGVNNAQNVYFYIQQQWNFYRNQAYAECMMPDEGMIESIRNDWDKLVPEYDSRDTLFENQGTRETVYNDYYYGY